MTMYTHFPREKHSQHTHRSVEWVQALVTLGVLLTVFFSLQLGSSASSVDESRSTLSRAPGYWSEDLRYGFSTHPDDSYRMLAQTPDSERVSIQLREGEVYQDADLRVSYYQTRSLDSLEREYQSDRPVSYSQLARGVAVIEGDLSSDRAKLVLATLHAQ